VKSVLEAIPVYWMSLDWIPKGVLENVQEDLFQVSLGWLHLIVLPWVSWKVVALPKYLGGWGLKKYFPLLKILGQKSLLEIDQDK
jgi:hypothetical protein